MAKRDSADEDRSEALRRRIIEWSESRHPPDRRQRQTVWERIEGSTRGPRPALTHDQIAKAAVEIADAEGLSAVSMRRLADRLGVATMSLYRYVSGKNDIYELMIDVAYGETTVPDGGWRVVATASARQMRALILRHPWLAQVYSLAPAALTPTTTAGIEQALTSIDGLGLDVDSMMAVFGTVNAFARGAVFAEVAQREGLQRQGWTSDEDARMAFIPWVRWLVGTGRYPMLTRYIIDGSNEDDAEWQFEFGLECVLDGIAARLGI